MSDIIDTTSTSVNGEINDKISVTFQRSIDVEGYGKNQRKVSATITMEVREDQDERIKEAVALIDKVIIAVRDKIDTETQGILVEMNNETGKVSLPKKTTPSSYKKPPSSSGYSPYSKKGLL